MPQGALQPGMVSRLVRVALEVGGAVAAYFLDQQINQAQHRDTAAEWPLRKVHMVWSRSSGSGVEDVAITTLHLVNITDDQVDATWTAADFAAVQSAVSNWFAAIMDRVSTQVTLRELRFYRVDGRRNSGEPEAVITTAFPGTSGVDMLPPQIALSVTLRTPIRKRWGRFYLPGMTEVASTANGRVATAVVNQIADATLTLVNTLRNGDLVPVVFSQAGLRALEVTEVQVDDVFDVQRSRRWATPSLRARRPIAA